MRKIKGWDCEKIREKRGNRISWKCKGPDGETVKVKTKLDEEKILPEEDYKYEGEINSKKVEGKATEGHSPYTDIFSKEGEEELTTAEKAAGFAHIDVHWGIR